MLQRAIAIALVSAGVVWSILFPKSLSLRPDMVLSVGIGVGLIGTGWIVGSSTRERLKLSTLSVLLLWSVVANATLLASQAGLVDLMRRVATESIDDSTPAESPASGR